MTENAPGPSNGRTIKQEEEPSFGFFDSLDILATIATQELKIGNKSEDQAHSPDYADYDMDDDPENRQSGKGSVQPKKLAEMDLVNMEQIKSMSANTLVRIFAETDFDEMKKMYCYSCLLMPGECRSKFQSFGNESKAKKEIRQHLEDHVDNLMERGRHDFTAEPILARKRRIKDLTTFVSKPQFPKRKMFPIKTEPQNETEPCCEKENADLLYVKKRKEDLVPLLSEISNDQELKRYRIKKEAVETVESQANVETEEVVQSIEIAPQKPVEVKQEYIDNKARKEVKAPEQSPNSKSIRIAIDEDHCYAFKPGRVKAEYWPEYDLYNTATAFTSTQEDDETYDQIKETSDLASVEAIESCPVIMEEEYAYEEAYHQEYVIENDETPKTVEVITPPEKKEPSPEYTTIVYQEQVDDPSEQYYTETIVTDVVSAEEFYGQNHDYSEGKPPVRIKNKRTVAAVSSEDKRLALNAMDELRSRGATTDDLMCRLCDPPRPFTAYSTLLTHYRSHAGLRPFECSLCGATFTRQHSLNYHLMTHANQTRFTCPHCNRKFRHPTHFKEHVKKHGEVVQFLCNFCPASLSTQSQYRKHSKMRHNKTIDIMGNIIDSPPEFKDREKVKRKRRLIKDDSVNVTGQVVKRKRRRKIKVDATEISQYEEVVQSSADDTSNTVVFEETIPLNESEQMYHNSELLEQKKGYEIVENVLTVLQPNQQVNGKVHYIQNQSIVSKGQPTNNGHNTLHFQSQAKMNQHFIEQYVSTENAPMQNQIIVQKQNNVVKTTPHLMQVSQNTAQNSIATPVAISHNRGAVLSQSVPAVTQQQSPMIFVVPNSGQKRSTEKDVQTVRKPLIINEQKKPIMISKFQTKPETQMTKIKQGVIAQINGQKVLLVPKKKQENNQMSKTTIQKIQPMTVKLASQTSNTTSSNRNIIIQTAQNRNLTIDSKKDTNVKIVSTGATSNANVILTQKKSGTYQNLVTSVALTEINPNTVQKTNVPENILDSKPNILEQALHEVFPSSLEYAEEETFSEVATPANQDCSLYEEYGSSGDLYNPMRSPLKNRNKILCEVLGIDS